MHGKEVTSENGPGERERLPRRVPACVIVADGARARFFRFEPNAPQGSRFFEEPALANPELQQPPHERFGQGRSESRGRVRGHWYGFDDRRISHDRDVERRFATKVAQKGRELCDARRPAALVLVADPKMTGYVRPLVDGFCGSRGIDVRVHAREMTKFSLEDIESNLVNAGLIPGRMPTQV